MYAARGPIPSSPWNANEAVIFQILIEHATSCVGREQKAERRNEKNRSNWAIESTDYCIRTRLRCLFARSLCGECNEWAKKKKKLKCSLVSDNLDYKNVWTSRRVNWGLSLSLRLGSMLTLTTFTVGLFFSYMWYMRKLNRALYVSLCLSRLLISQARNESPLLHFFLHEHVFTLFFGFLTQLRSWMNDKRDNVESNRSRCYTSRERSVLAGSSSVWVGKIYVYFHRKKNTFFIYTRTLRPKQSVFVRSAENIEWVSEMTLNYSKNIEKNLVHIVPIPPESSHTSFTPSGLAIIISFLFFVVWPETLYSFFPPLFSSHFQEQAESEKKKYFVLVRLSLSQHDPSSVIRIHT